MSGSTVLRVLGGGALLAAPAVLIFLAAMYLAYVHDAVFVSGAMPGATAAATTHLNLARWVWRVTHIASFVLSLVGARVIGAGSRLVGMLVIGFLTLQWTYIALVFFYPKDWMGVLWEIP